MKVKGQLGMDETVIDNAELEAALEARQKLRVQMSALTKPFSESDQKAKALIADVIPEDTIARVGRFRIERKRVEGRHVEFDSKPRVGVRIETDD